MRLVEAAELTFARHETFHPRYGWFRKAYTFVVKDPRIFNREDAPVRLGVGKNMVRAIRFWGLAAKLIAADTQCPSRRSPNLLPTRIGNSLFDDNGWDRYMEDPGTLWLLHWLLLSPPSLLPVWWLAFNEIQAIEFTDDDLEQAVASQLELVAERTKPKLSSIQKDISAMLRSYAPTERARRARIDDILDCPLRELNLIGRSSASKYHYRFTLGAKPTLPSEVLTYTVMDYVARNDIGSNTISLSRAAYERGSPGKAFKLSEDELLQCMQPTIGKVDELELVDVNGTPQLSWSRGPNEIATRILDDYYNSGGPRSEQTLCVSGK